MKVAIIGASDNPDRYAYRAQQKLIENGHETFPINLSGKEIMGRTGYKSILDIPDEDRPIHTITVYVNPDHFASIVDDVLTFHPDRVIFNPGSESPEAADRFRDAGIHVIEACTLVLLSIGRFETA